MPQPRRRDTSRRKPGKRTGAGAFFGKLILALVLAPVLYFGFYLIYPNVSALRERNPGKTAFMRYREREWEREGADRKLVHTWVPIEKVSPYVAKAVIISEDDKFWSHEGFDIEALEDAARKNLERREFAFGASTISQQLAKNLYLTPRKSILRKVTEAIITWRLERTLSKRRILELYLNVAEWGEGIFGIEAAARHYYNKSAASLTARQAARLAAVLPNPRRWNPTGGSRLVERRANRIYTIMARRGQIDREYDNIMRDRPKGTTPAPAPADSLTPAPGDSVGIPPVSPSDTTSISQPDSGAALPSPPAPREFPEADSIPSSVP